MTTERFTFEGHNGAALAARLDMPDGPHLATALFAHCFTCGKDITAARRIASRLASMGSAVRRVEPIDMFAIELGLRLKSLVVGLDAVVRIAEPDRPVGSDDDIIGAVETLALEMAGQGCDGAVMLDAADAAALMLARYKAPLAVHRVPVVIAAGG